jgi:menaquinol-cytochrome c reductase iron-sulfur subunit
MIPAAFGRSLRSPAPRASVESKGIAMDREGSSVRARSLLCTHQGCTVRWDESAQLYRCPCQKGTYDASRSVVSGAPTRPLDAYPLVIENGEVLVRPLPTQTS